MSPTPENRSFIRHVVFFSAKNAEDVDRIVEGLSMLAEIPNARAFEVTKNRKTDNFANDVEVVVYAEFESQEELTAYKENPIYQKCIDVVRPLREIRMAADF